MSLSQIILLLTAIGFLAVFVQVTLYHYRGRFWKWQMWIPVIASPLYAFLFLTAVFIPSIVSFALYFSVIAIIAGFIGFYYHIKGITYYTGGWNLDNVLVGPPFILPLLITLFGTFGFIALWFY